MALRNNKRKYDEIVEVVETIGERSDYTLCIVTTTFPQALREAVYHATVGNTTFTKLTAKAVERKPTSCRSAVLWKCCGRSQRPLSLMNVSLGLTATCIFSVHRRLRRGLRVNNTGNVDCQ
jgi:hypothetical protein